ncbi:unnamed protein product [Paramecium primaurelia]|uniref:Uncharacterized protein n=1 Tax=Paramecium primaurelia TaxID=5886 RepID=A0A8S1NG33_PARPR|nr:unnamed protein product [Paramecium primaurelia]
MAEFYLVYKSYIQSQQQWQKNEIYTSIQNLNHIQIKYNFMLIYQFKNNKNMDWFKQNQLIDCINYSRLMRQRQFQKLKCKRQNHNQLNNLEYCKYILENTRFQLINLISNLKCWIQNKIESEMKLKMEYMYMVFIWKKRNWIINMKTLIEQQVGQIYQSLS